MKARFRKKPIEIEAVRWDGDNLAELSEFTDNKFRKQGPRVGVAAVFDEIHKTWVNVFEGQWVIRGVFGEFYAIAADVLAETYDRLEDGE